MDAILLLFVFIFLFFMFFREELPQQLDTELLRNCQNQLPISSKQILIYQCVFSDNKKISYFFNECLQHLNRFYKKKILILLLIKL